jgi:hypothetical protein
LYCHKQQQTRQRIARKGKQVKISITEESKKYLTVEEHEIAKRIVKEFKAAGSEELQDYARQAAYIAAGSVNEVLKASASIARNNRAYNALATDTGMLDVWFDVTASTADGFVIVGACLSDLWQATGDNSEEIASHMYIRRFVEEK